MKTVVGIGLSEVNIVVGPFKKWPRESEQVMADNFKYSLGNGPQVSLLQLKKLGFDVSFATLLSNDIFSAYCEKEFKERSLEYINVSQGYIENPVNVNMIMQTAWNRTHFNYDGAEKGYKSDSAKIYDMCKKADFVIMKAGVDPDVYRRLKIEGKTLLLDTGWSENLSFTTFREYIQIAHYFFPNRREAEKLTGYSKPEDQIRILASYYKAGVIKQGEEGVIGYHDGKIFKVPAVKEFRRNAISGGGDSFLTGFIYGLHKGYDFKTTVLSGSLARGKFMSENLAYDTCCSVVDLENLISRYRDIVE